ncbi:NADPH-dependent FMN reductase [Candidatus Magnetobacterium bavaricum]|uniref:NADPH-dependent FMN reductase n=1 Tax=Candidatus Magnetobacterium bavaricum TaxID=29290 RepID=A0A0F3GWG2_9BACT|nr:NADPH-dependent FMN reductase [Candidatus Magnetobacterium bavaricum]
MGQVGHIVNTQLSSAPLSFFCKGGTLMKVLGVSGSPIKNGNTERALKTVIEATGVETELIRLIDYTYAPCMACLGCVETNVCVVDDDARGLTEKAKQADALVIGGFTPYSTLDARTKAFIERLYPLRHKHGYMSGKPGGAVVTCCVPENAEMLPPACRMGEDAIRFYMMEEGMNFLGSVRVQGNVPCITCGHGDECKMSAVKMLYGTEATVGSVGIRRFEDQSDVISTAVGLGKKIAEVLTGKK